MFYITLFLIYFFFFFNDPATTEIYTLSLHDALPIQAFELRRGSAGVVAEVVHHVLHGGHLRDDGFRGVVERPRGLAGKFVAELRLQAFRGELDRCERILDLVSESAGDLAPGGCALRRNQLRDVVEYHDVTPSTRFGQRRTPYE